MTFTLPRLAEWCDRSFCLSAIPLPRKTLLEKSD